MESLKQGAQYVSEEAKKATSTGSKEANKDVAKDSNASMGTRYVSPLECTERLMELTIPSSAELLPQKMLRRIR